MNIVENLKKIWDELLEKYRNQKLEFLLLLVLIIASIGFGIHDAAEGTEVSSSVSVEKESGEQESAEDMEGNRKGQNENREMTGKKGRETDEDALSESGEYESDEDGTAEDESSDGSRNGSDENEKTEDNRDKSGTNGDQDEDDTETGDARSGVTEQTDEENSSEDTDADDSERAGSNSTETDPDEKESSDVTGEKLAILNTQEDHAEHLLTWHTLVDTRELYGYKLQIPEEDERKFIELNLEDILKAKISAYDGDWSVYVKNLKTGEELLVNDRPMKSASVMKLFIMGTVYKAFESGELDRTEEIMSLMNEMITYSDNEASNQLLYRLGNSDYARGIAKVNEFIQEYGFSDMTVEYNGFNDPATVIGTGSYNQVSARDCGRLLEAIYRREWVSRSVSNEIEQMMLNQQTRYKIPAGLPEGVSCGNKTGEMDTTENDAAVIYGKECDYILVVLSSDWNSKDEAISRIKSISSAVYRYLNES